MGFPPSERNVSRSFRARNFHDYPHVASYVSNVLKNSHNDALDKARWQSAVKEAQNRGLDWSEQKKTVRELRQHKFGKARRHPVKHVQVLLNETSLPFSEIESIFFIPSAPPITSSNISTISLEIISGDAP